MIKTIEKILESMKNSNTYFIFCVKYPVMDSNLFTCFQGECLDLTDTRLIITDGDIHMEFDISGSNFQYNEEEKQIKYSEKEMEITLTFL